MAASLICGMFLTPLCELCTKSQDMSADIRDFCFEKCCCCCKSQCDTDSDGEPDDNWKDCRLHSRSALVALQTYHVRMLKDADGNAYSASADPKFSTSSSAYAYQFFMKLGSAYWDGSVASSVATYNNSNTTSLESDGLISCNPGFGPTASAECVHNRGLFWYSGCDRPVCFISTIDKKIREQTQMMNIITSTSSNLSSGNAAISLPLSCPGEAPCFYDAHYSACRDAELSDLLEVSFGRAATMGAERAEAVLTTAVAFLDCQDS